MIYLAFDDTDSRKGMCTTYLALELSRRLETAGRFTLQGLPSLVRLNPNVPWKTRGNGAVCLPLVPAMKAGSDPSPNFHELSSELEGLMYRFLESHAMLEEEGTDPGFAIFPARPGGGFYQKALHQLLERKNLEKELASTYPEPYLLGGLKKKRGIIGSIAAAAWPWEDGRSSFELIAYREQANWGSPRRVRAEGARELDEKFPSTFNNYDPVNNYAAVFPSSPCPVLYGIRGTDPGELEKASAWLEDFVNEPIHDKLLFRTNQGTDDHIMPVRIQKIEPYGSFNVTGRVVSRAQSIKGGHLFFAIREESTQAASLTCAAFEPTKEFRHIIRELEHGDLVECWGGVHDGPPFTLNVERLAVHELARIQTKTANPACPKCQRSMKSIGKNAGYRCRDCGEKLAEEEADYRQVKRSLEVGSYEVPVIARRHLAMPLKLTKFFLDDEEKENSQA